MTIPSFPFYADQFRSDTQGMLPAEVGTYGRMLELCWVSDVGEIPNDDAWLKRHLKATDNEVETIIRPLVDRFFTVSNGHLSSAWLTQARQEG